MPSVPSFFRAAYIGSPCCTRDAHGNRNKKEKERAPRGEEKSETGDERETHGPGRRDVKKTTDKDEGKNKKKKKTGEPLDVLYLRLLHTHLL